MQSDDLAPRIPRKRSRSPSTASVSGPSPFPPSSSTLTSNSASTHARDHADGTRPPAPKRLRRTHDVPDYHAPVEEHARRAMASANPLGRRVLKREAKKARRAATRAMQMQRKRDAGMDVDEDVSLEATFMG